MLQLITYYNKILDMVNKNLKISWFLQYEYISKICKCMTKDQKKNRKITRVDGVMTL